MAKELSLIPSEHKLPADIDRSIATMNAPLGNFLSYVGLPTENVLSPIDERRKVIQQLESVLEMLPLEEREKATYLSKFAICVTVGLFDGALSFLWDETIKSLRQKIIGFDLAYFYSVAQGLSSRYKGLTDPDEIGIVGDFDLLEACRRIGLIDDVNHRRLDNVNYFRNHASAAHPNDNPLTGIELVSFLEACLRYVICAPIEHSVVQVKRLLDNVRTQAIPPADFAGIWGEIVKLPVERIEDILQTLFGIFCDPKTVQDTLDNIRGLSPQIWKMASDDLRYKLGSKFGYYQANGEVDRKNRVQEFLNAVNGNAYKDENSLGAELIEKLQALRSAHYAMNNFYNERPHAESIATSLPASGIPASARRDFVKVISTCYIGNGLGYREGVDEGAVVYYDKFINRFDDTDIGVFVSLFTDHEFTGDLHWQKARNRAVGLFQRLETRTSNVLLKNALAVLKNSPAIERVANSTEYKRAMAALN